LIKINFPDLEEFSFSDHFLNCGNPLLSLKSTCIPTSLKEGKLPCESLEKINFPFTVTSNEAVVKHKNV